VDDDLVALAARSHGRAGGKRELGHRQEGIGVGGIRARRRAMTGRKGVDGLPRLRWAALPVPSLLVAKRGAGRLQGSDHERPFFCRKARAEPERAVLFPVVSDVATLVGGVGLFPGDTAERAQHAFELGRGRMAGEIEEIGLRVGLCDPGQDADLGVGEPSPVERVTDKRQVAEGAGHPDVLPGGAGR
jgi:hypothetical protein